MLVRRPGEEELLPAFQRTDVKKAKAFTSSTPGGPPDTTDIYIRTVTAVLSPMLQRIEKEFKRPVCELVKLCQSAQAGRKQAGKIEREVEKALCEREQAVAALEFKLAADKAFASDRSLITQLQEDRLQYFETWSSALARTG